MKCKVLTVLHAVLLLLLCGCQGKTATPAPAAPPVPPVKTVPSPPPPPVPQQLPYDRESSENFKRALLFVQTMEMLRKNYVDPDKVSSEQLFNYAVKGMVSALDPYSNYELPKEHPLRQTQRTGRVVGIGATAVKPAGHPITLIRILPGTPAAKAGLRPGDQITAIDGRNILKLNLAEALKMLRGRPDSTVKLQLRRGKTNFSRTLVRKLVENPSVVPGSVKCVAENIGYIKLTAFTPGSPGELRKALLELKKQKICALILDLRYNPGGLVDAAVNIASLFLEPEKVVFRAKSRDKSLEKTVKTHKNMTVDTTTPLIILTNAFSASCSEILTGALQDHKRARVLGVRSFGKGTILRVVRMPGGGALSYAASHYVTPGGRVIEKKGIMPDIEVRIPSGDLLLLSTQTLRYPGVIRPPHRGAVADVQLRRAVELLQRELKNKAPAL